MSVRCIVILAQKTCWLSVFCLAVSTSTLADRLLVLGDSLSAAYGLPSPEAGWVHRLKTEIEPLGHQLTNASVSGETTRGALSRLPDLLQEHEPDWVLLELGGNDGLQGQPVSTIKQRLQQLIDRIQAADADIILTGIRLPPNYGPRYTEPFFEQFSELAETNGITHFLPFLLEGIATRPELMQSDGIHPTAEAQPLILENVRDVLPAALKAPDDP